MKRLIWILIAMVLLTGCDRPQEETTQPAVATEPSGFYQPESTMEQQTGGAVRAYPLESAAYTDLEIMGSKLLLLEHGNMTVLQGERCEPAATLVTGSAQLNPDDFDVTAQSVAYYLPDSEEVVLLNPNLQQIQRIALPEDLQSKPAISLENRMVYYCVPGEIRGLNLDTGISSPVRTHSFDSASIQSVCFAGDLICCSFFDDQQTVENVYISTQNGQTLWGAELLQPFYTAAEDYYLRRTDGGITQQIAGQRGQTPILLTIPEENVADAMTLRSVLGYTMDETGLALNLYDIQSGKRSAQVKLDGVLSVTNIAASADYVWILAPDQEGQQILYRWDVKMSPVTEDVSYAQTLYTADNPDADGLAACQERADQMNQQYGVRIQLWQDAVEKPGDYVLTGEYQTPTISRMLDELEAALQPFPSDFLQKTVAGGWIYVDLVRAVDGQQTGAAQYWADGDFHIAIPSAENAGDSFLQAVGYAVDSHVLGNSRDFDDWDKLNPEGFRYAYNYDTQTNPDDWDTYGNAFLGERAMRYPHDDRAGIFYYAMTEHGADVFSQEILQLKLKLLCEGIREAYGLEKSTETYLWEQYLTMELDYNNIR